MTPDETIRANNRELLTRVALDRLGLLGRSRKFLDEIAKVPPVASCGASVLITGQTGTGKEVVARVIHYLSPRRDHPFVPVDCGAIPVELMESELFGHERGAFTGAVSRSAGLVAAAGQGTLFLDEVDSLTLAAQAKLLRFLQQKEYRPVGGTQVHKADVRVVSASNCDLRSAVREGALREDLFYRLAVVQMKLPALRERVEDIEPLARHFLEKYAREFKREINGFSPEALQRLVLHEWPGNVRELENVIQAAVALCEGPQLEVHHLPMGIGEPGAPGSFREAKADAVKRFERDYLLRLLHASGGNISRGARIAGKHRRAFWELIRKHGIRPSEYAAEDADQAPQREHLKTRRYSAGS
jgi:DNA-binding NtrC family response regulator